MQHRSRNQINRRKHWLVYLPKWNLFPVVQHSELRLSGVGNWFAVSRGIFSLLCIIKYPAGTFLYVSPPNEVSDVTVTHRNLSPIARLIARVSPAYRPWSSFYRVSRRRTLLWARAEHALHETRFSAFW